MPASDFSTAPLLNYPAVSPCLLFPLLIISDTSQEKPLIPYALQARAKLKTPTRSSLIPMLNVMMGILAFFVMITMTLGSEQFIEVQLPAEQEAEAEPPPLPAGPVYC